MRVREVADKLEVSVATVYALVACGKLRCYRVGTGRGCIRVSDDQLRAYLDGAEPNASVPPPPHRHPKLKHLRL